jgi:aspartate aminotransferase
MRELANDLKRSGVDVINFAAGELDCETSDLMKAAAKRAIDEGCNKYTPTLGMKELRERVAEQVSERCGIHYGAEEAGVTAGAKQALYNAAMVLFNPGDEIIIPQPFWVTLPAQVQMAGANPVFVDTTKTGYQLDPEDLERAITPATKAVIINSPNNPTGVIYEHEALRRISHIALERQIWIIFDEFLNVAQKFGRSYRGQLITNVGGLSQLLLREASVAVVPGDAFGDANGIRVSYAIGTSQVEEGLQRLKRLLDNIV